jgi:hypothetical protein
LEEVKGLRRSKVHSFEEIDRLYPELSKTLKAFFSNRIDENDKDEEINQYNVFVYDLLLYPPGSPCPKPLD